MPRDNRMGRAQSPEPAQIPDASRIERTLRGAARVLLTLLLGMNVASAAAQTTWDGGGDGSSWSDPLNWNPDIVPGATTDVLLDGGATVVLDVTAQTLDLTLDDATLDGPGDLTVAGDLNWALGTVAGDGVLTVTGGALFLEGPDKIIGRQVELACDAVWEDSHILFDIENGGQLHHHAGFTFSIVDHVEDARSERWRSGGSAALASASNLPRSAATPAPFSLPSGETILSSHLESPLVGEDPTADATDLYVFTIDGDVFASTNVTHQISVDIGGTYEQASGTSIWGSGSRTRLGATYLMGNGASAVLDEGTHLAFGSYEALMASTPAGMTTTGDQTLFIIDPEGFHDLPVSFEGNATLGDGVVIDAPVTVTDASVFDIGTGNQASVRELVIVAPSITIVEILGGTLATELLQWRDGNVRLGQGSTLAVDTMEIDQINTNLTLQNDGDPSETEQVEIGDRLHVVRTGSVPPRIDANLGFPNGRRADFEPSTEVLFLGFISMGGELNLGEGARWTQRDGTVSIESTAALDGLGDLFVEPGATVATNDLNGNALIDVLLDGFLLANGTNTLPGMTLDVRGGTVTGTGSLETVYVFNPGSPVERARFENVTARFADGSAWLNGHIDFVLGATGRVLEDATFLVSHTATNMQMTSDGDPGEEEKLVVEGKVVTDQTASVPPDWIVPIEIGENGTFQVEPNAAANVQGPMKVHGRLLVREGANIRFRFIESEVTETGTLEGTGSITEALGGNLDVRGTVAPGQAPGNPGALTFEGNLDMSAGQQVVLDATQAAIDQVIVTGTFKPPAELQIQFAEQLLGTLDRDIVLAGFVDGAFEITKGLGSATDISLAYTTTTVTASLTSDPERVSIEGSVILDVDRDGPDDDPDILFSSATVRLCDDADSTLADQGTPFGTFAFYDLEPGQYTVKIVNFSGGTFEVTFPESNRYEVLVPEQDEPLVFVVQIPALDFTVTNPSGNGPGSFSDALDFVNASEEGTFVRIDLSAVAGQTISPTGPLPQIANPVVFGSDPDEPRVPHQGTATRSDLDGGATSGAAATAAGEPLPVILDGSLCGDCDGLVLNGNQSVVRGLTIQNFSRHGIVIQDADTVVVTRTRIEGNGAGGIRVESGTDAFIGAGTNDSPNVVTANGGPGVTVLAGNGHRIRGNSIFANSGLAIDLAGNGPTPNDFRDIDAGPNELQNTPIITGADGLGVSVSGTLESRPLTTYDIEIYGSALCPESDRGDLETRLGIGTVTTDIDGIASFTVETTPYAGELSAIALSPLGSTSEPSECFMSVVTSVDAPALATDFLHFTAPNPTPGPFTLSFTLPRGQDVDARLYDVSGREIRTVCSGRAEAGWNHVSVQQPGAQGRRLESGVYFYRIRTESGREMQGRVVAIR